jgi:hypothetical protein
VVAIFLALGQEPQLDRKYAFYGGVAAAVGILAAFFAPGMMATAASGRLPAPEGTPQEQEVQRREQLSLIYQRRHLLRLAMLEGAALLAIVFFLLTTETWLLGVAAVPIALMAASFPWRERVELWLQEQLHLLETRRI